MDAERKGAITYARHLHLMVVVAREQLHGKQFQHPGLQVGQRIGQADHEPAASGHCADQLDELAVAVLTPVTVMVKVVAALVPVIVVPTLTM